MPPRRRARRAKAPNEAARLTNVLIGEGFTKKQIADILGRNSAIVSHFYSRGPKAGNVYVQGLRAVVQEVQGGGPRDVDTLKNLASQYIKRRKTKTGREARVRKKAVEQSAPDGTWTSAIARAGKQHISSGAARLSPVLESAAQNGGKIAFTVRASKGRFLMNSGSRDDSPGVHRNVVQRGDGTEERSYGNSKHGPGTWSSGFDAQEWHQRVTEHGGDVASAITDWMVETGRIAEGAKITNIELRAWKPQD
ncbi:hypothetical protein [Streptomyces venezuelae]|uniref:hypothetical protein n=1 Tax=Streptomyces venezuelae TaxID=54571 RepID=UPI00342033F7